MNKYGDVIIKEIETYYYLEIEGKENINQFYSISINRKSTWYPLRGYYPTYENPIHPLTKSIVISICMNSLNKQTKIRFETGSALICNKERLKKRKKDNIRRIYNDVGGDMKMTWILGAIALCIFLFGIKIDLGTKEPKSFYLPGKTIVVIGKEKQSYTFREGKVTICEDGLIRVVASDGYEKTFNKNSIEEIHISKY